MKFRMCFLATGILMAIIVLPAAEPSLVKDMVRLDQAYIPVLAFTSAEEVEASRSALPALDLTWNSFRSTHHGAFPSDPEWIEDLDRITSCIQVSTEIIRSGRQLKKAHESLESVRIILMEARRRHGIEYFIDTLTRYHEPMEAIVLRCKGTPIGSLDAESIQSLKEDADEAKDLWGRVRTTSFNAELFEFDAERTTRLNQSLAQETQALAALETSLNSEQRESILKSGVALKPPFARAFKLFGRFPEETK